MLYGVQKILEKISNKIRSKYSKYPSIWLLYVKNYKIKLITIIWCDFISSQ